MRGFPRNRLRHLRYLALVIATFVLLASFSFAILKVGLSGTAPNSRTAISHHGPWIFGHRHAQFTIVEYSDLECPYCRAYFPVLQHWIGEHSQVNWEWWNMPLAMHDPVASREAQLAECVGEVDGNRGFWRTVDWIYRHTRGDGAGITPGTRLPGESPAIRACLETSKVEKIVRAQVAGASRQHIAGTPTLRIVDHMTGRSVELQGPVGDDLLLSAVNWLAAQSRHQMRSATPR